MFRLRQLKILRTSYQLREQEVYGSNEDLTGRLCQVWLILTYFSSYFIIHS